MTQLNTNADRIIRGRQSWRNTDTLVLSATCPQLHFGLWESLRSCRAICPQTTSNYVYYVLHEYMASQYDNVETDQIIYFNIYTAISTDS